MSVPFTTILQSLEKGNVNDLASESLAAVVERVKATGKKSTIVVKLTGEAASALFGIMTLMGFKGPDLIATTVEVPSVLSVAEPGPDA